MALPKLPAKSTERAVDTVAFLGLNRTQNTKEGELRDTKNLSAAEFPCITQRGTRTPVTGWGSGASAITYSAPTDIFAWDGHLVVVDGTKLYIDNTEVAAVTEGLKQFAVVNTKLCIWPDKIYIDLTNITSGSLAPSVQTSGRANSVAVTDNSFTAVIRRLVQEDAAVASYTANPDTSNFMIYTYGKDRKKVEACCHSGTWNLSELGELEELRGIFNSYGEGVDGTVGAEYITIPVVSSGPTYGFVAGQYVAGQTTLPDKTEYNSSGYYVVLKNKDESGAGTTVTIQWHVAVYQCGFENPVFSGTFKVGDAVTISNTLGNKADVKHAIVRELDDENNKLTFDDYTFADLPDGYNTSSKRVKIEIEVPNFDFICAKDNRLWGVSNAQTNEIWNAATKKYETFTSRCIYASALGDPANFWVFDGVDTDSWQVAVGSEGDFTAIGNYGDAVCCWKEHRLYKVHGNYPSEFYTRENIIEGVAAGCHRSLTVVNEVLYYVGATGIYAYAGYTPQNIGYQLDGVLSNAAAGSDGKRWYLSGTRADGANELLTYDLKSGIWLREDGTNAKAFAMLGGTMYVLETHTASGVTSSSIFKAEQGTDTSVQWYAEFVPFLEDRGGTYANTHLRRRYYLRLLIRLEMASGSSVTVEAKQDGDAWKTLLNASTTVAAVKSIEIPTKRSDKLTVRISGTGHVLLRHMAREYILGSDRP